MTSSLFTTLFVALLLLSFGLATWLTLRHIAHIRAHRATVPGEFHDVVTIDAHQKAADYTVTRQRLGLIESVVDAGLLLLLTLGGGVIAIHQLATGIFSDRYAQGLTFVIGVAIVCSVISIPFDWYRTFAIEARFGFNKITVKLYLLDALKGVVLSAAIGIPLLLIVFWLMEKMGALWWLYVWLV